VTREPFQPTPRRSMTPKRRLEALLRSEGRCARCKVKLGEAFEVDHEISLFLGGANAVSRGDSRDQFHAHRALVDANTERLRLEMGR